MRSTSDAKLHLTKNKDDLRAISFGYDFCAEQEIGISFSSDFCGDGERNGQSGRVWTKIPANFMWVDLGEWQGFGYERRPGIIKEYGQRMISNVWKDRGILAAWDDKDFMIIVKGNQQIGMLKDFFNKCINLKTCFFPANEVDGSGLCIAVTAFMSEEFKRIQEKDALRLAAMEAFNNSKAKAKLEDLREKARSKKVWLYYPCYMGASSGFKNKDGTFAFWLNDSRVGKSFGWKTDDELCAYLDDLAKEFGLDVP